MRMETITSNEGDTMNTTPTRADFIAVGKYTKETDPDMVAQMRRDGYRTGAEAVGRYVYELGMYGGDDMFGDILDWLAGDEDA